MIERVCSESGFTLVAATGGVGWRITKDQYVRGSGINGVLVNRHVGPLAPDEIEKRGRYDTLGRTVYFGASKLAAFAEVLQQLRVKVLATAKDAHAIGQDPQEYLQQVTAERHERGMTGPGEVPVDWQMTSGLFRVDMPASGWWVRIDAGATLDALSTALRGTAGMLSVGDVCGSDRVLTTRLAEIVRGSVLDDDSLPLGIEFPSKTGYGTCWAWWNRRADDNLNPGRNDPQLAEEFNLDCPELREICRAWDLQLTGSRSHNTE